jgi:Ca2+-transporting ATPase
MIAAELRAGLAEGEVARRLAEVGPNEIRREEGPPPWRILARQFRGPMIWLLAGACALAAALGEIADATAIGVIILLNGAIGFFQEFRAERAMSALRAMTAPRARVRREGRAIVVPAASIVPGDVLLLEAGDVVAADARIAEAHVLSVNEAALTGESLPVEKSAEPAPEGAPLAERTDRVFMGTAVAGGAATAVVTATGMSTELGRIAGLLATAKIEATPLEVRLEKAGRSLLFLCLGVVALVAALGIARDEPWLDVLVSSVALAVAAVPEGLAAIVTIALAIGVQRMAGRNVLVRKLPAVETLGCATVICTDKTGTLTTGVMAVRELWGSDHRRVLEAAVAASDAELGEDGRGTGDPTELAILASARERAMEKHVIEDERPRVAVHPFDSDRKRMSIRREDGRLYVKGAVDVLLPLCTSGADGALEANGEMAERGLRVLAVAVGRGDEERDLELVGLIGIADPPRTEAIEAVRVAREAGIRTVMITGDHPITARAIARELGILQPGDDADLVVHARATPDEKIAIVRDWKARGEVVAMTGDGVNDAPALREAHIGIAMGRTGTEVAREASSMILTDDDFASIVAAIREGRGIFDNVRKTLVYLLTGNVAELTVVLGASVLGLPLPLTALQILWINLVTDGLPALALVMDPPDRDVLRRPPRRPTEAILESPQWRWIGLAALIEAAVVVAAFVWALGARGVVEARSLAFSVLVFSEVLRAFAARSPDRVFFETGVFTNVRLLGVVAVTVLLQLGIHHVPVAQELFEIGGISLLDVGVALALGLVPVSLIEVTKLARRALGRTRTADPSVAPPESAG